MNLRYIAFLLLLVIPVLLKAQFYTDLNFGYGFNLESNFSCNFIDGEYIYDSVNDKNQKLTSITSEKVEPKPSKGIFITNEIGYLYKKKISFSILSFYQNNYWTKTEMVNISQTYHGYSNGINTGSYTSNLTDYSSLLSFTPQLSYYVNFRNFSYIISLGYTLGFAKIYRVNNEISKTLVENINTQYMEYHRQFYSDAIHSFTIANKIIYNINSKWSSIVSLAFTPINFSTNKIVRDYHRVEDENTGSVYEDTEEVTVENSSLIPDHKTIGVYLSVGVRCYFVKKEDVKKL